MRVDLGLDLEEGCWWVNGTPAQGFADTPDGRAGLKHCLQQMQVQSCRLLVSGARIEYRLEPIPPLKPQDSRALLTQRLQKSWPDHPLKRGELMDWQGQPRLLMAAMALGPILQQGLSFLKALDIPVAGVFDLGEVRVKQLGKLPSQSLVIHAHEGRLHQYWVVAGQICFARQSPGDDVASAGARELPRILAHLQSEHKREGDEPLAVVAIVPDNVAEACRHAWEALPGIHLNLRSDEGRAQPMTASLAALSHLKGLPQYASSAMLHPFRRRRYLRLLTHTCLLLSLGLGVFGAWQFHEARAARTLLEREQIVQKTLQHQLDTATKEGPPLPLALADLQGIQQQRHLLLAPQHALARQWPRTKALLQNDPQLRLEHLRWQPSSGLNLKGHVEGKSPRDALSRYQVFHSGLQTIAPLRALADPLAPTPEHGWSRGAGHPGGYGRLPFEFLLAGEGKP